MTPKPSFEKALENLINEYSIENQSDTPDFILAELVAGLLSHFAYATRKRDKFFGFRPNNHFQLNPDESAPVPPAELSPEILAAKLSTAFLNKAATTQEIRLVTLVVNYAAGFVLSNEPIIDLSEDYRYSLLEQAVKALIQVVNNG